VSMERLWAPWRMEFIRQVDKGEGCFLCQAAASDDDHAHNVVWRNDTSLAVLNRWPYNNGHLLVAPHAHKGELDELTEQELADQVYLVRRAVRVLKELVNADGFNVGMNLGRVAGAGVPGHLHWHVVPRWNGDTNFMPVVSDTKVMVQSLEELWELLRNADTD